MKEEQMKLFCFLILSLFSFSIHAQEITLNQNREKNENPYPKMVINTPPDAFKFTPEEDIQNRENILHQTKTKNKTKNNELDTQNILSPDNLTLQDETEKISDFR